MKGVGRQLQEQRKSLRPRVSTEKLAQRAGVSASTVRRAEAGDPKVSADAMRAIEEALAGIIAERASLKDAADDATVAQRIEHHARALLQLAFKLRESESEIPDVIRRERHA